MSPETESVASRIDADSKALLELAVEECGTTMSAYLKPVIEAHIEQNPRDFRALASDASSDPDETNQPEQNESEPIFIDQLVEDLE